MKYQVMQHKQSVLMYTVVVQLVSHDQLFATSWTAAHQASLSFNSWTLLKLMSANCYSRLCPCPKTIQDKGPKTVHLKDAWNEMFSLCFPYLVHKSTSIFLSGYIGHCQSCLLVASSS